MKNKIRTMLGIMAITVCLSLPICGQAAEVALGETEVVSEDVEGRAYIKEWVYKVENNKLYKRLYNYTTGRWETDWILVAEGV